MSENMKYAVRVRALGLRSTWKRHECTRWRDIPNAVDLSTGIAWAAYTSVGGDFPGGCPVRASFQMLMTLALPYVGTQWRQRSKGAPPTALRAGENPLMLRLDNMRGPSGWVYRDAFGVFWAALEPDHRWFALADCPAWAVRALREEMSEY